MCGRLSNLHKLRNPLNNLLRKNQSWNWSTDCQKSFDELKRTLASDLFLIHFDPNQKIVVAADASNKRIGAKIMHESADNPKRPSAYASRSLTPTERNYSQIEKEAPALTYAVKKSHRMLYGRECTLQTNHKPLLAIFGAKNGIPVYTASRLQRWATLLLTYNFKIRHIPTSHFYYADALSRLIPRQNDTSDEHVIAAVSIENDVNESLNKSVRHVLVTTSDVQKATARDPVLQKVTYYINHGWAKRLNEPDLQQFYRRCDSISIVNQCPMFTARVVISKSLQKVVLKQSHSHHLRITRMKALMRRYVYWPSIDQHIEELVQNCSRRTQASKMPIIFLGSTYACVAENSH